MDDAIGRCNLPQRDEFLSHSSVTEFLRHRVSLFRWFARRYRDEATEQTYTAEEMRSSGDNEMERMHRDCAASAIRIARHYDQEAKEAENQVAQVNEE